ncbi:MAG: hypothetical protein SFU86_03885, partial [Pirellulaceae bacterium]|nr:hypothetical protein [Pirellulaceae bacterium]
MFVRSCSAALASTLIAAATIAAEPASSTKRQPPIRLAASQRAKVSPATQAQLASARTSPQSAQAALYSEEAKPGAAAQYAVINLEFENGAACAKFRQDDVFVFARHDRFADVFALNNEATIKALSETDGLVWMEEMSIVNVPPPARPVPRTVSPREIPDKIVRGGVAGRTGKGVIVAVIDSGIDFRHPDFITYDAQGQPTSRLLYFWDVASELSVNGIGEAAPVKFPSGTPIGTVYSRDVLTAELRSAKPQISVWDPNGH